jgi:hypothetical protein
MQQKRTVKGYALSVLKERLLTECQYLKLEENFFYFTFVAIHIPDNEVEQ